MGRDSQMLNSCRRIQIQRQWEQRRTVGLSPAWWTGSHAALDFILGLGFLDLWVGIGSHASLGGRMMLGEGEVESLSMVVGMAAVLGSRGKEEGLISPPQWGEQETREMIMIRAELERSLAAGRRRMSDKTMWEAVASRMIGRGYHRTTEQCKCKWKNLVSRYKEKETSDPESCKQCPFFEELHAVFTERARTMQYSQKPKKRLRGEGRLSTEFSDDDEENKTIGGQPRGEADGVYNLLKDFLQQQHQMEVQWWEAMERRAKERMVFEQEWRESMERIERERLMLDQVWWERQEQRRIREERRAEERDALLTTLLNKYIHEDQSGNLQGLEDL